MEIKEGWFVVILLFAAFFAGMTGFAGGMESKCDNAWLASHNAADSAVVARVCKVSR